MKALEHEAAGLGMFLANILLGLADAGRIDLVEQVTKSYVAKGERLWECIRPFAISPLTNRAILHEAKDPGALSILKNQSDFSHGWSGRPAYLTLTEFSDPILPESQKGSERSVSWVPPGRCCRAALR